MSNEPRKLLEESGIQWSRDWDALLVGFALGVLMAVAVLGVAWN